jgi:hypothetical protein
VVEVLVLFLVLVGLPAVQEVVLEQGGKPVKMVLLIKDIRAEIVLLVRLVLMVLLVVAVLVRLEQMVQTTLLLGVMVVLVLHHQSQAHP